MLRKLFDIEFQIWYISPEVKIEPEKSGRGTGVERMPVREITAESRRRQFATFENTLHEILLIKTSGDLRQSSGDYWEHFLSFRNRFVSLSGPLRFESFKKKNRYSVILPSIILKRSP